MRTVRYAGFIFIAVLLAVGLTGCGGGGGDGGSSVLPPLPPVVDPEPPVDPDPPVEPEPPVEPDPDPPVEPEPEPPVEPPVDPPVEPEPQPEPEVRMCEYGAAGADNPALCERGRWALPGIDKIPLDRVQVTNREMQKMFVIVEAGIRHARSVGGIACESYVTASSECAPFTEGGRTGKVRMLDGTVQSTTGSAPFTQLVDLNVLTQDEVDNSWFEQTMRSMGTVKIVNYSAGGSHAQSHIGNGDLPYLIVHSVGNGTGNFPWFRGILTPSEQDLVKRAIAAHKLLFVAGWDRTADGMYIRHADSDSCRDLDDGCLWARYDFSEVGRALSGTSFSAPQVSAALASVLAVFPDTSHQDLAKFGKSCAKKTGEGIEALLAESGGTGVADFNCMGDVVSALTNLPTGGTANVVIDGETVQMSGRRLSLLSYASSATILAGVPESGGSFTTIANGERGASVVGSYSAGAMFASVAAGPRDDFFGHARGHEGVFELRGSAGHKNLFLTLSEQYSTGGSTIRSAHGTSFALMAQERFSLTGRTTLTASAGVHRFLGGEADLSSGSVSLGADGWDHRFSLASATALDATKTVGLGAIVRAPEGRDEEFVVSANLNWRF